MVKVLHVVYGGTGGAARIVLDIAMHHDMTRFHPVVVLVGYQVDPQYLQELQAHGITGETLLKEKKWDGKFCRQLRKIFFKHQPDVLLLHTPVAYFWGRPAAAGLGIKAVISVEHLAMANYYGRFGRLVNLIQSHLATDQTICVSQDVKTIVKKELLLPEEKIQVIENGIPVTRYRQADPGSLCKQKPVRIKMVARLDRQKDPATLLRAIKLLKEENMAVKLDFIGTGVLQEELAKLTADLAIEDQVSFLGMRSDVADLLLDTDIFVLSTHGEGLPIALLEAMAVGLPCVATRVPGTENVLENNISGLLVPENDPRALSQAISFLIKNPETAQSLGMEARKRVEKNFSILRTVREYEKFFDRCLASLSN